MCLAGTVVASIVSYTRGGWVADLSPFTVIANIFVTIYSLSPGWSPSDLVSKYKILEEDRLPVIHFVCAVYCSSAFWKKG